MIKQVVACGVIDETKISIILVILIPIPVIILTLVVYLWQTRDSQWTTPACTTTVWSAWLKILSQFHRSAINAAKTIKFDLSHGSFFPAESTISTIWVSLIPIPVSILTLMVYLLTQPN